MPATHGYFLGLSAVGLLCIAACRAQITQRVDVRIPAQNWDTLAAATVISTQKNPYFASHLTPPIFSLAHLQGKSKDDGNDYVSGCIRVNGGPWSTGKGKRKGSSTWQPLGRRASVKFKDIDPELTFGDDMWTDDRVTLNNDIIQSGYSDAFRVHRTMGTHAPNAYLAMVAFYRDTSNSACNAPGTLEAKESATRYTVIQRSKSKEFLAPYYGKCTWAVWETEGELKMDGAAFDAPLDGPSACLNDANTQYLDPLYANFQEATLERDNEMAAERERMSHLENWHRDSFLRYVATDAVIRHHDGPTYGNGNGNIVRSTRDLDCAGDDAAKCNEGGLYYMLPHGVDQTLHCHKKGSPSYFNKDTYRLGHHLRLLPMSECFADPDCAAGIDHYYSLGMESAHRNLEGCNQLDYPDYAGIIVGLVVALALPFAAISICGPFRTRAESTTKAREDKKQSQKWNWVVAVEMLARVAVCVLLFLIILPVPISNTSNGSMFNHFTVTQSAGPDTYPTTTVDYDLTRAWTGTLERQTWASALRYNEIVHFMWFHIESEDEYGSLAALKFFSPGDDRGISPANNLLNHEVNYNRGQYTAYSDYISACSNLRNECCFSHRLWLGANVAVLCLFFLTLVWHFSFIFLPKKPRYALFVVSWKAGSFCAYLFAYANYYAAHARGYYCNENDFDDYRDGSTVTYGMLFYFALVVSIALAEDLVYELYRFRSRWPEKSIAQYELLLVPLAEKNELEPEPEVEPRAGLTTVRNRRAYTSLTF